MRLTAIKLAGFKSFVDPTTLKLPTNMTAIVGPNGCGKSNIIDAIRWVMGESAASRLRGDALVDVIFSGSTGRKPVGQAVVELLFDNSDAAIQGEFAGYNDISVRRVVTREGQSQYFLNHTRCRRRDITDLFLGTGLGPRSYSIIEQGMISRIIEARPEQLRVYLEEAAGISRYKERRRETERRLTTTRENLDRVRDIRDEVAKQLEHLQRQARAAEKWQELKQHQSRIGAEVAALQYRRVLKESRDLSTTQLALEADIERQLASQTHAEALNEALREKHHEAGERLNEAQAEVYRIGAELARIEQQIRHAAELEERLQHAEQEMQRQMQALAGEIEADRERVGRLRQSIEESGYRRDELEERQEEADRLLQQADEQVAAWQEAWEECNHHHSEAVRNADVERTRCEYLEKRHDELQQRRRALMSERDAEDLDELERAVNRLEADVRERQYGVEQLQKSQGALQERFSLIHDEVRQLQTTLAEARTELQETRGRLASLEALQASALRGDDDVSDDWLRANGIDGTRRLAAVMDVAAGWEVAVETVLAGWLEGVIVSAGQSSELAGSLKGREGVHLPLLEETPAGDGAVEEGCLAAKARAPRVIDGMLRRVAIATSLDEAIGMVNSLDADRSVVTPDGEWLGPGWARVARPSDEGTSMLIRERLIREGVAARELLEARVEELDAREQALAREQEVIGHALEDARQAFYQAQRQCSEASGKLESLRGRLDMARRRHDQVDEQLADVERQAGALEDDREAARESLDSAMAASTDIAAKRDALQARRRELLETRAAVTMQARDVHDQFHALSLAMESQRAELAGRERALQRMAQQKHELEERGVELARQREHDVVPAADREAERSQCLDQRLEADRRLVAARQRVTDCDTEYRKVEAQRQQAAQALVELREKHATTRMREQALAMEAQRHAQLIADADHDLAQLLERLPDDATVEACQAELTEVARKIARLEPVNLAAIQEFESQSQRRGYLDEQLGDLAEALATLEAAIRKIDRETRELFKDTFERVNGGMQELFPRLFGGGQGRLELTGEDLLDTGVTILARPPGKRVSAISLLSGGEKAMTAFALVMAIFRLNPAPFCLLDEVDAPLDEANVGRFTQMLREMSAQVQFLFITHDKATMEAADQLCGVTMREPGVSRLVQVDLAEAEALAAEA